MKRIFKTEQRTYHIDPRRVVDFYMALLKEGDEAIKAAQSETSDLALNCNILLFLDAPVIPCGVRTLINEQGFTYKHFYGQRVILKADILTGKRNIIRGLPYTDDGTRTLTELGNVIMNEDGSSLVLNIKALDNLAFDPKIVYQIADDYRL